MNRPWRGTDGKAVNALAASLENIMLNHSPRVLNTKPVKGQVKTRGAMFDLPMADFLTFWKQQVISMADAAKHANVITRLELR